MKMLKKMAALLLAGVMAMALLTACGEEAPSKSFAQQVEETAFEAMKQSTGIQVNDADLKKLAESKIDLIDKDGQYDFKNTIQYSDILKAAEDAVKAGKDSVTIDLAMPVPQEKVEGAEMTNGKYPVWEVTADNLGALAEKTAKLNAILSKQMRGGKIEKVGVVSKTVNGKTYVAIGLKVTVPVTALN